MHKIFEGSNSLSSKEIFKTRRNYKHLAIPESSIPMVDFWYDDSLYGKIDALGNAIYPITNSSLTVKPLRLNTNIVNSMFFVEEAYYDFRNKYSLMLIDGLVKPMPAYDTFSVKSSLVSIDTMYDSHISKITNFFVTTYLPQFDKCIRSFDDVAKYFIKFMKEHGLSAPITKTGYIMSPTTTNAISGLIVDLEHAPQSEDAPKEEFFDNETCSYPAFLVEAARHGFLLDKNSPWRLVANIHSQKITEPLYVNAHDRRIPNPKHIFEEYYFKSYVEDHHSLYQFVFNAYNLYFIKNPNFFIEKERSKGIILQIPYSPSAMNSTTISAGVAKKAFVRNIRSIPYNFENSDFWYDLLLQTRLLETVKSRTKCDSLFVKYKREISRVSQNGRKLYHINEIVKSYDERLSLHNYMLDRNRLSGVTSEENGHRHIYVVDGYGNGYAESAHHPENDKIAHRHEIRNWTVLGAKSSCYPNCRQVHGYPGVPLHSHVIKKQGML